MSRELRMENEKYKFGKIGGITLISLVITIVVLIILASVGIYLGLSNNGILNRANEAKELTNKQTATEKINLKITTAQMNKYADEQRMPTLKELSEVLRYDNEIQYVTEKSQMASTKYEVGENPTSIYTKLNDYPYEFEINGQLQLASIDGIKIEVGQKDDGNINGIQLLWSNDKPNYTFIEQTINIDLSNYEAVLILVKANASLTEITTSTNYTTYAYGKIGETIYCTGVAKGSAGWYGTFREASIKVDGITFGVGRYGQLTHEYTSNSVGGIPLYIWGVKKDIY